MVGAVRGLATPLASITKRQQQPLHCDKQNCPPVTQITCGCLGWGISAECFHKPGARFCLNKFTANSG